MLGLSGLRWLPGRTTVAPVSSEKGVRTKIADRFITMSGNGTGKHDASVPLNGQSPCQYPRSFPGEVEIAPTEETRKRGPSSASQAERIRGSAMYGEI